MSDDVQAPERRPAGDNGSDPWLMLPVVTIVMFVVGLIALYGHDGAQRSFGAAAELAGIISLIGTASYARSLVLKMRKPVRVIARSAPGRHRR